MMIPKNGLIAFLVGCFFILQAANTHGAARWGEVIRKAGSNHLVEAVEPTSDGGYILAGLQFLAGNDEAWCAKLDGLGNLSWQHMYGEAGDDAFEDIQPLSDGTFFVTGGTRSFGAGGYDIWCLLLGPTGNVLWQKTYGGSGSDVGLSGKPIPGGGFVVVGWTSSFGSGLKDVLCLRLDASGNVVWQKAYGGAGDDYGRCIHPAGDGGFIISADTRSFSSGNAQIWIVKLEQSGSVDWQKGYGVGGLLAHSADIKQTTDGGYITSGLIGGAMLDSCVLKLTSSGAVSWQAFIPQSAPEYPLIKNVCQVNGGSYVASGHLRIGGIDDAWFVGLGSNGNVLWQRAAGGPEYDSASSLKPTIDGGFVAVGETLAGFDYAAFVSRHSSSGDLEAGCNVQGTAATITSPSIAVATTNGATITTAVTVGVSATVAGAGLAVVQRECSSPVAPDLAGSWSKVGFRRSKLNGTLACLNAGSAASGASTVKVYFSKKGAIGRKAKLFKTQNVGALPAFGSSSFKINATPGSKYKYVVAVLDAANTVAEDDEGNNIAAWRFR